MKKLLLTLAVAALACTTAFAQTKKTTAVKTNLTLNTLAAPAGTAYSSLTAGWGYVPNAPACPQSGTLSNCLLGFNVTITQNGTTVFTSTAGYGSGQNSPSAVSATWTPTSGVAYATYVATVTAVGYDVNGTQITSTPSSGTLVVGVTSLAAPTGVTLTGK